MAQKALDIREQELDKREGLLNVREKELDEYSIALNDEEKDLDQREVRLDEYEKTLEKLEKLNSINYSRTREVLRNLLTELNKWDLDDVYYSINVDILQRERMINSGKYVEDKNGGFEPVENRYYRFEKEEMLERIAFRVGERLLEQHKG